MERVECACSHESYLVHHLHPVFGKFWINHKGYPVLSRQPYRNKFLHRMVWERTAGVQIPQGWHVHHQDGNKMHCCPWNLVAVPAELHPAGDPLRCPYTGRFLTVGEYRRRMGELPDRLTGVEVPF